MAALLIACVALFVTSILGAPCATLQKDVNFPYCVDLAPNGTYSLAWKADETQIWLAIDVDNSDPNGFAGLGLSEAGGMKAADIIVVSRSAAQPGILTVQDLWSEANAPPALDAQQVGLCCSAAAGRIRAVVRRPLHSCDSKDISFTPGLPQHVIWSRGSNWPSYHGPGNRGETVIDFLPLAGAKVQASPDPTRPLEEGAKQLDVLMPNVTIPAALTSYLCTHFHLPDDQKYHIIARQALVRSPLVHHMILFSCTSPRPAVGTVFDCLSMEAACSGFAVGWAPGEDYAEYGPEAGFAFGTGPPQEHIPSWFALQTHYNNPKGLAIPSPDTSGLRLTYTPRLRPNDLGVLVLTQLNLNLPPGQERVVAAPNLCPAECTSKLTKPVTMIGSLLHMHTTGKTITSRHIRGNKELPPLGSRRVWDFNYQGSAPIPFESRQLLPGDSFITQCTYDTTDRTNVTRFGEGTMDEMCFNFVLYYPKVDLLGLCRSMEPAGPGTATCGSSVDVAQATNGLPPPNPADPSSVSTYFQTINSRLQAAGLLVNATWPKDYTPWTDPLCPSGTGGAVPLVQASSGAP